jgi:hypothetical protein
MELYDRWHGLDTCELYLLVIQTYGQLRTASNWELKIVVLYKQLYKTILCFVDRASRNMREMKTT